MIKKKIPINIFPTKREVEIDKEIYESIKAITDVNYRKTTRQFSGGEI